MVRNRYILLSDLPLVAIAASGAFALRFDWLFVQHRPEFVVYLVAAVILKPLVFFPFGMYSRYWRYGTAQDLVAITLAVSASSVVMAVFVWVVTATGNVVEFARPVLMIDWLLTLAIETLVHDVSTEPGRAQLALRAELIRRSDRSRVAQRVFSAAAPVAEAAAPAAVTAFGTATADVLDQLADWVEATVAAHPVR